MPEQCQRTERRGDDTFRCGKDAGHDDRCGRWQFVEPSERLI